jgi:hypothetical protein
LIPQNCQDTPKRRSHIRKSQNDTSEISHPHCSNSDAWRRNSYVETSMEPAKMARDDLDRRVINFLYLIQAL